MPESEQLYLACGECGETFDDLKIAYDHSWTHVNNPNEDMTWFHIGTEEELM